MTDPQAAEPAIWIAARTLKTELRLRDDEGNVGIGDDCLFVMIYDKVRKPPIIRWHGFPVRYHIGGGMPVAYAG